jgi:hypothetical protein
VYDTSFFHLTDTGGLESQLLELKSKSWTYSNSFLNNNLAKLIRTDIKEMRRTYHHQVSKKKNEIDSLYNSFIGSQSY